MVRRIAPSLVIGCAAAASLAQVGVPNAFRPTPMAPVGVDAASFTNWENPHVSPIDLTPDGSMLLAVNTADNRLEVFDLSSGSPVSVGAVPVGLDPVSVRARTNTEAWVVNHISDSVSIVDLSTMNVVATVTTADEPADVVFAGTPQRAFVTASQANLVQVFDPASLGTAPTDIVIEGEDPRALAVSPDGLTVYAAVFESGNNTTILGGGLQMGASGFPPNVISDPAGPHGGVNPPPNSGAAFHPPMNGALPPAPAVGLIVRQDSGGAWSDDTGADWTDLVSGANAASSGRPVGWTLLDHDVAIIDANSLSLSYADGLMNACMAMGVNPVTGDVTVVGLDATNEIRFEPVLNGRFVRVNAATFTPGAGSPTISDINTHLTYGTTVPFVQIPQTDRDKSLGDPRGIAWNAAGTKAYITGMGSNNLVVIDTSHTRVGLADTIEVGEGPTGVAIDEARGNLYVLNRFDGTISVVDLATELETAAVPFFDPTPDAIKTGRKHLYDTRKNSGLGQASCASCHIDARMDTLSWDLGDPSGSMKTFNRNCPDEGCTDWHPMKGPMATQTLQDIIGHEPHHWRSDREGIEAFSGAFLSILGDDANLSAAEMQQFEDFLATIHFPPNPFRNLDNTLPTGLPLTGHFTTGRFGAAGLPMPSGDAQAGLLAYRTSFLDSVQCVSCHTLPTGTGINGTFASGSFVEFPPGPNGELNHATVSVDGSTNVSIKVPHLRNMHEKSGFNTTQLTSTRGFGYLHDGSVDSLERFLTEPVFSVSSLQQVADLTAFMLAFSGSDLPDGSPTNALEPPGSPSQDTHAAVGTQVTIVDGASPPPADAALVAQLETLADAGAIGLVVKGLPGGVQRGYAYTGAGGYQSDRAAETITSAALIAQAAAAAELTWTAVPIGNQTRIGIDRDLDLFLDRDEVDQCADPTDALSTPLNAVCCVADVTTTGAGLGDPGYGVPDGSVTAADLNFFVNAWVAADAAVADVTTTGAGLGDPGYGVPDGSVTAADLNYFVNAWVAGCP